MKIEIFNRKDNEIYEEKIFGKKILNFLYNNALGRLILKVVVLKFISKIYEIYNETKLSKKKIEPFVKEYNINLEEFEKKDYESFSDFFIRKRKTEQINKEKDVLISPADSKLIVYDINDNLEFIVKNNIYSVESLIQNKDISEEYKNGKCLIFRLSVDDYHRYSYVGTGKLIKQETINGKLHTVTPIATERYKVYSENHREVNYLDTEEFGEMIQIEVGALLVGKIVNYNSTDFKKGDEKGYFKLGGSTIILLFKENIIEIDSDILEYSNKGIETKIRLGEKIGIKKV